jgi:hypothetical protein
MITLTGRKVPRVVLFVAVNAFALFFVIAFLVAPVLAHFIDRSEDISENAAQLAHFQSIVRKAKAEVATDPQAGDPFLAGREERVVSADLQANLKSVAAAAGVLLLGVRGVQNNRSQQLHMVAVSVEIEGALPAIRDMVLAIESQTPFLFVTEASFRSIADGDGGPIRAELKVQGATHGDELRPEETTSQ